jgi:2-dehydro-3-deoxygluconokinase
MVEKEILLVGEPMGLFISKEVGSFEDVEEFYLKTCGAELNVAIGIKRLGHIPSYMTKLGDDPFGRKIIKQMKTIGISTDEIIKSQVYSTGFMFKSKVIEGDPEIFYFRKGSAASTLCGDDVKGLDYSKYDIIHCTGITPALTDSTKEATEMLLKKAKENNIMFSFDPNLRPQLWESQDQMSNYINMIASQSDLFMPGVNEAKLLINEIEPEKIAKKYLEMGAKIVIVKNGSKGAYYANKEESGFVKGFEVDKVIDTVGAGDGFAAGVLTALKEGKTIEQAVRRGNAVGAIQVMSIGDNDGLPTTGELTKFMSGEKNWR